MDKAKKALGVVILAAGKGTRMQNPAKAKVLFQLNGRAMIDYVVDQALQLQPERIVAVVGYRKEEVKAHLQDRYGERVEFADQDEQLGTGHAVQQTQDLLGDFTGPLLILSGDVPLLRPATLENFYAAHRAKSAIASVLSADIDNPDGYGRILRADDGSFQAIVEHKDADAEQRRILEFNSGIYLVEARHLYQALAQVSSDNAQNELYLTDIIAIIRAAGGAVQAWRAADWRELIGINTKAQLDASEERLRRYDG